MEGLYLFIEDLLSNIFSGLLLSVVTTISVIFVWFIVGHITVKIFNKFFLSVLKLRKNEKRNKTIKKLVTSSVKIFVWFIVSAIILSQLGIDIAPVLASAGIVGVALGFGAQSVVKDIISGTFLLMEEAYYMDELIEINGFKGTVIRRGLRSTSLQNWKGEIKLVSNGDITDLINYSRTKSLAVVEFKVPYSIDLKKINDNIKPFLKSLQKKYSQIVENPQFLGVTELGENSLTLCIIAKTLNSEHFSVERGIRKDVILWLKDNNLSVDLPKVVVTNK